MSKLKLTPPAGLNKPYEKLWRHLVQQELNRGRKFQDVINQVNHSIGIHEGIHDRIT